MSHTSALILQKHFLIHIRELVPIETMQCVSHTQKAKMVNNFLDIQVN